MKITVNAQPGGHARAEPGSRATVHADGSGRLTEVTVTAPDTGVRLPPARAIT